MASGQTPDGNGSRPKAADFGRRASDSTDPTAGASSDEIIPGPGDSTNPNASAPRTTWKLLALHGPRSGGEFPLQADEITLGRGTDNGITIPDVSVSRHHVRFEREGDAFAVVDLKSGNGTKVNGERQERAVLQHGDEIALGDTVLQMLNVALPLPERYRGAPPLVPSKKAAPPPPPESHSTPPRASAPAPATAAVTDTAPSSTPAAPPPAVRTPAKKQSGNSRMPLYAAIFVAMMIVFGWKYWRDHQGGGTTTDTQKKNDLIEVVRQMARDRKWSEALAKLVHEGPAKADVTIQKWTDGVRNEATAQNAYEKASNALIHGDYKVALDVARAVEPQTDFGEDAQTKIIDRMPAILTNALVDARAALRAGDHEKCADIVSRVRQADPTNADAIAAQQECVYRPVIVVARDAGPAPEVDAGPQGPVFKCYGPAVTQYLQDRVDEAIKISGKTVIPTCQNLEAMLIEFSNHRSRGQEASQNKRVPEAAKEFDLAWAIDDKIAEGRSSIPGRQVREQLSRMEYFLALDAKGDEQLPNKAKHLLKAYRANPANDLAKQELDKCYGRAHEIFQEAYQMKAADKEGAIRLFRIVAGTLPEDDPFKGKAKNWIDQLAGQKK